MSASSATIRPQRTLSVPLPAGHEPQNDRANVDGRARLEDAASQMVDDVARDALLAVADDLDGEPGARALDADDASHELGERRAKDWAAARELACEGPGQRSLGAHVIVDIRRMCARERGANSGTIGLAQGCEMRRLTGGRLNLSRRTSPPLGGHASLGLSIS
jgi:hypothetical protein